MCRGELAAADANGVNDLWRRQVKVGGGVECAVAIKKFQEEVRKGLRPCVEA
jgi:hypothetical protein